MDNAFYCCKCDQVAFALYDDDERWYCYKHSIEKDTLGEWADLVGLVEESISEVQEMR